MGSLLDCFQTRYQRTARDGVAGHEARGSEKEFEGIVECMYIEND